MGKLHLASLLLALPVLVYSGAYSGEITINCDSRVVNEKSCIALLQDSLQSVGCQASQPHCLLHPWGSDFVKSWICSAPSSNCEPSLQMACVSPSIHVFDEVIDVCEKSKTSSVRAICSHEHAAHSVGVKACSEAQETCARFGGVSAQCSQISGSSDQSEVSCSFPSLHGNLSGSNCAELKSRCERTNSEKGVRSTLLSCVPELKN